MLTQARLKELFVFDPYTGLFTRIKSRNKDNVGVIAGTIAHNGYVNIWVDGKLALGHRMAWIYAYGETPVELDHINGIRSDNRISNLRIATRSQNGYNQGISSKNKSGVKGVSWNKKSQKWQVHVQRQYLGMFEDLEDARLVAMKKRTELHGEFVNHG